MAFHKSIVLEMRCPACTDYMHPPIKQCTTGHSFCHRCSEKRTRCTECYTKIIARNFTLERIYHKIQFPCTNNNRGCPEVDVGDKIKDHQRTCSYTAITCPLKANRCIWVGHIKDVVHHYKMHHPENVFFEATQQLRCRNFLQFRRKLRTFVIFNVYDRFFECAWDVNYETGLMRWCVFLMKKSDDDVSFDFEIVVQKDNDPTMALCLKAPCPLGKKEGVKSFNNKFVFTHYEMVKEYCRNNDLIYTVKIIRRDA